MARMINPGTPVQTNQPTAVDVKVGADTVDATDVGWDSARDWTKVQAWWNSIVLMFYGYKDSDPENVTFSYEVYLADLFGGGRKVCEGTGAIGDQRLSHNPVSGKAIKTDGTPDADTLWADTIDVSSEAVDEMTELVGAGGDDNIALLLIKDRFTAARLFVRIHTVSDMDAEVHAIATGF